MVHADQLGAHASAEQAVEDLFGEVEEDPGTVLDPARERRGRHVLLELRERLGLGVEVPEPEGHGPFVARPEDQVQLLEGGDLLEASDLDALGPLHLPVLLEDLLQHAEASHRLPRDVEREEQLPAGDPEEGLVEPPAHPSGHRRP